MDQLGDDLGADVLRTMLFIRAAKPQGQTFGFNVLPMPVG